MELNIEIGLKNISEFWGSMNVTMDSYKDIKNLYRLKAVDDIFQALEENMVNLKFIIFKPCFFYSIVYGHCLMPYNSNF